MSFRHRSHETVRLIHTPAQGPQRHRITTHRIERLLQPQIQNRMRAHLNEHGQAITNRSPHR
ncbi:hypothetical protein AAIB46_17040, partial [Streptomyces sp. 35M1]|uniref:hypothetical protein n=1 Tax=Streptomyces sp. 35M1 TaxID=3142978 RepID=UPI0039906BBF